MQPRMLTSLIGQQKILILFAVLYLVGAVLSGRNMIVHAEGSTKAIEAILSTANMKNEGSEALERYGKEHPLLAMFFSSPLRHELELPSHGESAKALSADVEHQLKTVRLESSQAAWWSWFYVNLSFFYVVTVIALARSFTARSVIFSLTLVSVGCFIVGIFAPAMVIWTTPSIPMESGNLEFVLQHQVRGIAAIIWELLTTDHWIIGGFLLLFSICTPLTKLVLTFFLTASQSKSLNYKIGQFLHAIGKWSMADVFVAGVLLAIYALKAQQATKSIPCLGLYYFTGYCILSMTTTQILVLSGIVDEKENDRTDAKIGNRVVYGLFAALLFFIMGSGFYTYQQYTLNTKQQVKAPGSPQELNNADLVLPVHK